MPQVVNKECAVCRGRIRSVLDGDFCLDCGNPVHHACRRPTNDVARSGICGTCSADVSDTDATRDRLMQLERDAQEREHLERRQADLDQRRRLGKRDMVVGAFLLVGGVAFTGFDFLMAISQGGGEYLIATGAIAFGAFRLIRGVLRALTA